MSIILYVAVIAVGAWLLYSKRAPAPPKLDLPYLKFEGDNSASRYRMESETILGRGYAQYTKKGSPFTMRDPNDPERPMVMLPAKYIDEIKWIPENRMSFWKHIDKQSILSQIGGPGITEEVALAARQGLNRALEWTSMLPYPLLIKIFASMSACAIVGPELGGLDSEWQGLSMNYVSAALSAPSIVKNKYPTWLYWLSQYTNGGVRTMWKHRARAREILTPVLQNRINATEELKAKGIKKPKGPRKYEDGVQWLLDAHTAHGKILTPDQLAQDLFVIMTASIHSTSGAGLAIIFDMLEHPDTLSDITQEILEVQSKLPGGIWTRKALGQLKLLDSFMRESARVHALTQYTAAQRIPTETWSFKDGLTIPSGFTMAFPSYHHNFDSAVHPHPDTFDAYRHLRKREESNTHKFHFASVSEDMLNWGAGRHACPGRFFAQETLKLLIIHMLVHYEFKHEAGNEKTPRFISNNLFLIPNPALPILFKERELSL
ncbi:Cytochrome P450 monooxygenase [Lachnellula willkommii]|uniref:Cytochrome P450 monooxygenase n=1 Tax=Lachnellula willkommii TaxID=215461 RepID=A0A559MBS1_9HELO|nr:Cytochrome P450 monooxygenase [Lachnellula willkommii]